MILKYGIWCGNSIYIYIMVILILVYIKEIWLIKNFCTTYDIAITLQLIYQTPAFLHSLSTCNAITLTSVAKHHCWAFRATNVGSATHRRLESASSHPMLTELVQTFKNKQKKRPMAQPKQFLKDFGGFSFTLFVEERKLHHHAMVILVTESLPWNRGFWAAGSSLHDVIKYHQLIWKKNIIKNIIIIVIIIIRRIIYSYSLHSTILSLSLILKLRNSEVPHPNVLWQLILNWLISKTLKHIHHIYIYMSWKIPRNFSIQLLRSASPIFTHLLFTWRVSKVTRDQRASLEKPWVTITSFHGHGIPKKRLNQHAILPGLYHSIICLENVVQMIYLTTSHPLINIYRRLSMYQGEQNGVTIQKYRHSNKRDGHVW